MRKLANTDYFDIMLLHWQHAATWPTDTVRWQDGILEAAQRRLWWGMARRCTGCRRCAVPGKQWLDIAMIRMNHKGTSMDARGLRHERTGQCERSGRAREGSPPEGMGVISMKLVGEGTFTTVRTGRRR